MPFMGQGIELPGSESLLHLTGLPTEMQAFGSSYEDKDPDDGGVHLLPSDDDDDAYIPKIKDLDIEDMEVFSDLGNPVFGQETQDLHIEDMEVFIDLGSSVCSQQTPDFFAVPMHANQRK